MRAHWMRIVLVLSLCFNIFFAAGYYRSRVLLKKLGTPEGRDQVLADRLELDQRQRATFLQLLSATRSQAAQLRKANAADADVFWQEMLKDNPDTLLIREILARSSQVREQVKVLLVENMLKQMRVLRPEQRRAYVEMFRKRSLADE